MRNLETSGWMTNPELSIIEAVPKDKDGSRPGCRHQGAAVHVRGQGEAAGTE
jgi:Tfp pilus assembly protein PilN